MEAQALVRLPKHCNAASSDPSVIRPRLTEPQEHERRAVSTRGQEALDHAIAAAELYMQAAGKARTPEDRKRLRRKFADLVALGERLKATTKGPAPAVSRSSGPPVPESSRPLTTAEKTIILKASRLHGSVFPPWESAPGPESFTAATSPGGAYTCVTLSKPLPLPCPALPLLTYTCLQVTHGGSRSLPSSRPSSLAGGVPLN